MSSQGVAGSHTFPVPNLVPCLLRSRISCKAAAGRPRNRCQCGTGSVQVCKDVLRAGWVDMSLWTRGGAATCFDHTDGGSIILIKHCRSVLRVPQFWKHGTKILCNLGSVNSSNELGFSGTCCDRWLYFGCVGYESPTNMKTRPVMEQRVTRSMAWATLTCPARRVGWFGSGNNGRDGSGCSGWDVRANG